MHTLKRSLVIFSVLSLCAFALTACKSTTTVTTDSFGNSVTNTVRTIDATRVASVANEAANVGTTEILRTHPEWKPQFQLAADNLNALAVSPTVGLQDIVAIAQQLPVSELKSQTAKLSFEGATILISALDVPELPADRLAELQPICKAIANGILTGLANSPAPAPSPVPTSTTVTAPPAS